LRVRCEHGLLVSLHADVVERGSTAIPIAEREVVTSLAKQIASHIVMYLPPNAALASELEQIRHVVTETQRLVQGGRLSAPQLLGGGTTPVSELLAVQSSAIPLFDCFGSDGSTLALAGKGLAG
jgi:hypothetical protein